MGRLQCKVFFGAVEGQINEWLTSHGNIEIVSANLTSAFDGKTDSWRYIILYRE